MTLPKPHLPTHWVNPPRELAPGAKRVLVVADFHCGHRVGVTPARWDPGTREPADALDLATHRYNKYAAIRAETWGEYCTIVDSLGPIHLLIVNGDCIDGRGDKSGGLELIEHDLHNQVKMASEVILRAHAKSVVMTFGTAYHSGKLEDKELGIAELVQAVTIGAHEWPEVNGRVFDVKHKIGRSSIPHGRSTPMKRAALWNMLWADVGMQPRATVFIRSHVHYFDFTGDAHRLGIITPALQAMGTKYGARECEGLVDWGMVIVDVEKDGSYDWRAMLRPVESQRAKVTKV